MDQSEEARLLFGLIHLHGRIQRKLSGALSVHGLALSEYLVLTELADAPNQTMRRVDLAERVGLTASGVTRLLNPMEKIGLVEKSSGARDARVSLVTLSSAGHRLLGEAGTTVNHVAETLLGHLSRTRRQDLSKLLHAMLPSA